MKSTLSEALELLGIKQLNSIEIVELVDKGLTKGNFKTFCKTSGCDPLLAAKVISVNRANLVTKKFNARLNNKVSEKLLMLAEVFALGKATLEKWQSVNDWMSTPIPTLASKRPIELMTNTFGFSLVKEELLRIEHGLY